ncbi:MAG: SGNH/GDSL hydrolase family protein [Acidimicrobiaceae bacterium]
MNAVVFGITLSSQAVIALVFATVATLLVGLEAILRLSERLNPTDASKENTKTYQKVFDNTSELNSAVQKLSELHGHLNGLHLKSVNFKSPKFNVVDGWRLTTEQPAEATADLYLFGGSTVQCIEVQDRETICSNLQRLLNSSSESIRVNNRGVSGMTVRANQIELAKLRLKANDIVVVYFGANDSKLDVYLQVARMPFRFIPGYTKILGFLRIKLKLRVAEWIWLETVKPADRTLKNAEINAENVEVALIDMNHQALEAGAMFFALLQPNVFTKKSYSKRDLEIHNRSKINPRIVKIQYNEYIKRLRKYPWFHTITDSLDTHPDTPYLDWCHLDSSGNNLVAKSMFNLIKKEKSK